MEHKKVELPTEEEIKDWITQTYAHLNPDVRDFFIMGIEALYTKLGGNKFLVTK